MDLSEKTEEDLTNYIHDLFLDKDFIQWRMALKEYELGAWHSLLVKLDRSGASITRLKQFGEDTYSKLVFNYVKAPDYKTSQMLMIQFTVAGSMWHSVVWHCPERN